VAARAIAATGWRGEQRILRQSSGECNCWREAENGRIQLVKSASRDASNPHTGMP